MDNAGENKILAKSCDQNEMGIKFEYTAPGTPQQNGVVEGAFVTLIGRGRAMMNHAKVARTKLDPRGRISMFVGYSLNHPADTIVSSI